MTETVPGTTMHVKFDVTGRATIAIKPSPVPLSREMGSYYSSAHEELWQQLPYGLRGVVWKLNELGGLFDYLSYYKHDANGEDPYQCQALKIRVAVPGAGGNDVGIMAIMERLDEVTDVLRRHFGISRDVPLLSTQTLAVVAPFSERRELVRGIGVQYGVVAVEDKSFAAWADQLARRRALAETRVDRELDSSGLITIRVTPSPVPLALVPASYDSRLADDKIVGNPELARIAERLGPAFSRVFIHYGNDADSIRIELQMRRHGDELSDKDRALATMNFVDSATTIVAEEFGLPDEVQTRGLFTNLAAAE